jgi:hypothetical protein
MVIRRGGKMGLQPVTSPEGKKGFFSQETGFIDVDSLTKVTNPEGQKGYYNSTVGFIPEPAMNEPPSKSVGDYASEFGTGVVRGITKLGAGIGQRIGAYSQQDIDAAMAGMADERKGEGFAGKAGEFVGETAPYMVVPGGQATALGRMAVNVGTGAGAGFLQPTKTGESATTNAVVGGVAGAVIPSAVEALKRYGDDIGKWLYSKALKTPISEKWKKTMPGSEFNKREIAVETGYRENIYPTQYGKARADQSAKALHESVEEIVDNLTQTGNYDTNVYDLVRDGLAKARRGAASSSDSTTASGAVKKIEEDVIKKGGVQSKLNPRQLQDLKEQFYKEIDWDRTKNVVSPGGQFTESARKGVANEAMKLLEDMHPEIAALNKKTGAYINLRQALEHSIARYDNLNVGGIQAMILAVRHIGLAASELVLGTPTVKAALSFAIQKGATMPGVRPVISAGVSNVLTGGEE